MDNPLREITFERNSELTLVEDYAFGWSHRDGILVKPEDVQFPSETDVSDKAFARWQSALRRRGGQ